MKNNLYGGDFVMRNYFVWRLVMKNNFVWRRLCNEK